MATWTTTFSAKSQYTLTLTLTEKSYNIATNKSTVEYTLTMACSGYVGFSDYRVQASLTVGGVQKLNYNAVRAFNVPVKASYSEVLATGTIDITHALDGTGSCVGAAYVLVAGGGDGISPGRAPSSGTLGGTLTLTTIPRASTATVPSAYTIGSAGSAISIATASSAFSHRLKFSAGSQSQTVNLAAGTTSYTWTPAAATWGPQFPTQTSRSVTVLLETLSGGTVIGSNTYTTTLSIPASWKPTVSASLSQYSTNSFMSGKAFYVAGYSAIRAAITGALGDSYTTIKSYTISGAWSKTVTTTASSTTQTSGVIASSGTKTTTITITDARGRTGTWSGNVSFLSYAVPAITTLTYARGTYSGGVWTSSASGTDLRIQFKATCSLSGNGNDMDWTIGAPVSASGTSLASGTQVEKFKTGIGTTTLYTVTVTVRDDIGNTVTKSITVPTVEIPFTIDHALPGIGVGAIPQTARTFELANNWQLNPGKGIVGYRKVFSSSRNLSAAGWYNFLIFNSGSVAERNANRAFVVDINIMRTYNNGNNEVYHTKFMACYANFNFVDDFSRANTQYITQVRYAYDSNNVGYLQLYYNSTSLNEVTVECTVYAMNLIIDKFEAGGLSNGGGTASATHDLSANFLQNVFSESHTSASVTIAANGSGYADVTITKAGFTPIGVIGIGGGSTNLPIASCQVTSTTNARIYVRNVSSAAVSCTFTLKILYVKT